MSSSNAYARFVARLDATPQATIHMGLDVMRAAVEAENLGRPASKIVIVAGTNGKGTVAAALSTLCTQRGWTTTLLTSPHLVDFRERIRINNQAIDEATLIALGDPIIARYGAESGRSPRPLTYFELSVLLGLAAAKHAQSDVLILEVGLGGRLDASNVIDSDLSVFTSISLDHTDLLGSTLSAIAREKAAVARVGHKALLHEAHGGVAELEQELQGIGANLVYVRGGDSARARNLALASAAFAELEAAAGAVSDPRFVQDVLADFQWPGRLSWERTERGTPALVDGSHNAESAQELGKFLQTQPPVHGYQAVIALSAGRQAAEIIAPAAAFVDAWHVCAPDFARASPAAETAAQIRAWEAEEGAAGRRTRPVHLYASVQEALNAAEAASILVPDTPLLIFGSLYLVGDVYRMWADAGVPLPSFSKSQSAVPWRASDRPSVDASARALGHASPEGAGTWQEFLSGPWFPQDRPVRDVPPTFRTLLPLAAPRFAAFYITIAGILLMTLSHLVIGGRLPFYAGLALGTLVGNILPALVVIQAMGIPMPKQTLRLSTIVQALWMGVVFSITGALLTGAMTELYSMVLEGTAAWTWWTEFLTSREASYEAMLSPKTVLETSAALATIAFLPGICEEFFFRGVLYRVMDGVATWRKVAFIGVLFAAIHLDPVGFVPLCILGVALTWLRALTGAWIVPALVHIAFNGTALAMALFASSMSLEALDTAHPEAWSWEWLGLLVLFAYSAFLFQRFGAKRVALRKEAILSTQQSA